jgi:hypothetical protein
VLSSLLCGFPSPVDVEHFRLKRFHGDEQTRGASSQAIT